MRMHDHRTASRSFRLLVGVLAMMATTALGDEPPLDLAEAAALPTPGMAVPSAVAFAPDGQSVSYLFSEDRSLTKVLWRADAFGKTRVIARAPGGGETEANVSPEEALRRERQRRRDTGIGQIARAEEADFAVTVLGGDLYMIRGDGPLDRLTTTEAPEIDPRLAPDGAKVAFVREQELWSIDLADRREVKLSAGSTDGLMHGTAEFIAQEELDRDAGFWWSPDGKTIAYQQTDERHVPGLVIANPTASPPGTETHRYPFAGAANAKVKVGVVAATGGPTRWLDLPRLAADDYLARVDWAAPNRLVVQTLSRDQKSIELIMVDVASGAATPLYRESSEPWYNLHHDLHFLEETGEWIWSTEATGFRHLALHAPDGKRIRPLTAGEWAVDRVVHLDEARREVWFLAARPTPLDRHLFRVSLDGGEPVQVTTEPGFHEATVSESGERILATWSAPDRPPVTRLSGRDGSIIAALHDGRDDPRLKSLDLSPPELIELTNREGTTLFGAFYAPKEAPDPPPLVVLVYGGPHVQTVTRSWSLTADMTAQLLRSRGFAVWRLDNRGSARRGLKFEAALHLRMGSVEVLDQVDGVRWLAEHRPGAFDPARVGISGGSYGGYMTLKCLADAPDTFAAGVALAPVTEWEGYDTGYTERYMSTPQANTGGYRTSSVLAEAARIRGKLLLIHGQMDENVHYRHTAKLVAALIAADRPFELLAVPDERHSARKPENRRYQLGRLVEFFERNLAKEPAKR